jgi:hypothetical protein
MKGAAMSDVTYRYLMLAVAVATLVVTIVQVL